jgi:hypothetical protein
VTQRAKRNSLAIERIKRLESFPGWSWDPHEDKWEKGFSYLKEYSEREGDCKVSAKYRTVDEYRLGQWVQVQRNSWKNMSADRKSRLEALPGWPQRVSIIAGDSGFAAERLEEA